MPLKLGGFGNTEETINPSILRGELVQEDSAKKSQRENMTGWILEDQEEFDNKGKIIPGKVNSMSKGMKMWRYNVLKSHKIPSAHG